MNLFLSNCPEDCAAVLLPAIDVDQNCTTFDIEDSEICGVLIVQDGNYPADWTSVADWEGVINNAGTTAADGKYLVGRGGIAVPDKEVVELPKGKDRIKQRTYSLPLNVYNMSDLHYDFLRAIQCGDTSIRFWVETVGGFLYGGPTGIEPNRVDSDLPLGEGRADYERGQLILSWIADGDPNRASNWAGLGATDKGGSQLATVFGYGTTAFGYGTTAFGPRAVTP